MDSIGLHPVENVHSILSKLSERCGGRCDVLNFINKCLDQGRGTNGKNIYKNIYICICDPQELKHCVCNEYNVASMLCPKSPCNSNAYKRYDVLIAYVVRNRVRKIIKIELKLRVKNPININLDDVEQQLSYNCLGEDVRAEKVLIVSRDSPELSQRLMNRGIYVKTLDKCKTILQRIAQ